MPSADTIASAASARKNVRTTGILLVNESNRLSLFRGRICAFVSFLTTKVLRSGANSARIRGFGLSRPPAHCDTILRVFLLFFRQEGDVLRSLLGVGLALAVPVGLVNQTNWHRQRQP